MRSFKRAVLTAILPLVFFAGKAQNPNWTLPGRQYQHLGTGYTNLPQNPSGTNDSFIEYTGTNSVGVHGGYTAPDGSLLFFTVDEALYDKNGYKVGNFQMSQTELKRGFNERLIIPMGNSCTKFAIIFIGSKDQNTSGYETYNTNSRNRLYMAIYDTELVNPYFEDATGALVGMTSFEGYTSLVDIAFRDGTLYDSEIPGLYGFLGEDIQSSYSKGIQIAATGLINNCFHYVFVSDGGYLIRYKLTENDLEWDNYTYDLEGTPDNAAFRSEMELIELSNGLYRIAVPAIRTIPNQPKHIIQILDMNSSIQVSSSQIVPLGTFGGSGNKASIGVEFEPTGRYLYFTIVAGGALPNALYVWDHNTAALATIPALTGIGDFRLSFIERFGNNLYLAKGDRIGKLSNISNPISLTFNANEITINSGYGNNLEPTINPLSTQFRYILPEQLDMAYPSLASMSCECCRQWSPTSIDRFVATASATWTPTNNPFGNVTDVYITDEMIINPGVDITISGMNFYFGKDARVLVRRQETNETGAYLNLVGGTVFTADNRCGDQTIDRCGIADECERELWQGIVVEGFSTNNTQAFSSSTPHGRLQVSGNAMIEYARIGARAGNVDLAGSNGGIIRMNGARVKDCINGVWFDSYLRLSGSTELYTASSISYTQFRTTSGWIDGNVPGSFVTILQSSGLNLKANSFINEDFTNFSPADRGIGLNVQRSRVTSEWTCGITLPFPNPCPPSEIDRSVFENLYYGVYGLNSGLATRTFYDYHSLYINNTYGIYLNNFINPEVLDSEFKIPSSSGARGIYLDVCTGYIIENNRLTRSGKSPYTKNFGITVSNSGAAYNEIYRNTFDNIGYGGYVQGINADLSNEDQGLQWRCNTFNSPMTRADIANFGYMSDDQGSCIMEPAGNLFSHSSQSPSWPAHIDLFATSGGQIDIDYQHHDVALSGQPRLLPLKWTGMPNFVTYNFDPCPEVFDVNSCPIKKSSLPIPINGGPSELSGGGEDDYNYQSIADGASVMQGAMNEAGTSANETANEEVGDLNEEGAATNAALNGLKLEYARFWNGVVSHFMKDTLGTVSREEMAELLVSYQPECINRFDAVLSASANASATDETQNTGVDSTEESSLFLALSPSITLSSFESVDFVNELNRSYYANGKLYDPIIADALIEALLASDEEEGKSNDNNRKVASENHFQLLPNPFNDQLQLRIADASGFDEIRVVIHDVVGKVVYDRRMGASAQIILETEDLPVGMLIYSIYTDGNFVQSGKVLKAQ